MPPDIVEIPYHLRISWTLLYTNIYILHMHMNVYLLASCFLRCRLWVIYWAPLERIRRYFQAHRHRSLLPVAIVAMPFPTGYLDEPACSKYSHCLTLEWMLKLDPLLARLTWLKLCAGCRSVSIVFGTGIGGLLAQPALNYPSLFDVTGVFGMWVCAWHSFWYVRLHCFWCREVTRWWTLVMCVCLILPDHRSIHGSSQEDFKFSQAESGWVSSFLKYHGSARFASSQQVPRLLSWVGSPWPDSVREKLCFGLQPTVYLICLQL